ncbi:MAG: hypothetical protein ABR907_01065 [Terracidiphilus sp.]
MATVLIAAVGLGLSLAASGQSAVPAEPQRGLTATGAPAFKVVKAPPVLDNPAVLASPAWAGLMSAKAGDSSINQGVKVHGHWVIDVKNSDGSLANHREFENALEADGSGFLVGLMSGFLVPGDWMIVMGPQSGNGACLATFQYCGIVRSLSTYPAIGYCASYDCATGLTYTYNFGTDFGGPYSIVLAGSITANQTGTIGSVYSLINTCANIAFSNTANPSSIETSSPASCVTQTSPTPWYGPLTDTNITPISVNNGQIIQVTVTLTFS